MKGKRRTREDPVVRRAQIVDQGLRIIGELGYYGFTIQALAERCEISNAGLLYYFGSKDKVLLSLLDEIERRVEQRIEPFVASATSDAQPVGANYDATARLLRAMVEHFLDDVALTRFVAALQLESIHETHPAHGWFRDRENETLDLFEKLAAPWAAAPRSAARQLYALMHGIGQQWLRDQETFDLLDEWDRAFRIVLPPPGKA